MHVSQLSAGLFLRDQNILAQEGRVGATAWEVRGIQDHESFLLPPLVPDDPLQTG